MAQEGNEGQYTLLVFATLVAPLFLLVFWHCWRNPIPASAQSYIYS